EELVLRGRGRRGGQVVLWHDGLRHRAARKRRGRHEGEKSAVHGHSPAVPRRWWTGASTGAWWVAARACAASSSSKISFTERFSITWRSKITLKNTGTKKMA